MTLAERLAVLIQAELETRVPAYLKPFVQSISTSLPTIIQTALTQIVQPELDDILSGKKNV